MAKRKSAKSGSAKKRPAQPKESPKPKAPAKVAAKTTRKPAAASVLDEGESGSTAPPPPVIKAAIPPKAASPAEPNKPVERYQTQAEAARAIGVDRRTFIEWTGRAGFPLAVGGWWDVTKIRQWAESMGLGGKRANKPEDAKSELYEVRLRRETAQAGREELKLRQELGQLLDLEDVARMVERVIATAKAVLGQLPDRLDQNLASMIDTKVRRRHREAVVATLRDTYAIIEQMITGDDEEDEEEEKEIC